MDANLLVGFMTVDHTPINICAAAVADQTCYSVWYACQNQLRFEIRDQVWSRALMPLYRELECCDGR